MSLTHFKNKNKDVEMVDISKKINQVELQKQNRSLKLVMIYIKSY